MNIPTPIRDVAHLRENARTYMSLVSHPEQMSDAAERNTIIKTLSTSRGWFAFEEGGDWLLVPAKFGGYEGMTPSAYEHYRRTNMHGAEGERACKRVSSYTEVGSNHPAWRKLKMLAAQHRGREPSSKAIIYAVAQPSHRPSLTAGDHEKVAAVLNIVRAMSFDDANLARGEIAAAL